MPRRTQKAPGAGQRQAGACSSGEAQSEAPPQLTLDGGSDVLTIAEAARLCGLSKQTLRSQVAAGKLRSVLIAPRLRLTTGAWVDDYMAMYCRRGSAHPDTGTRSPE